MRLVDLTHPFTIHTPGWVGYPSPKLEQALNRRCLIGAFPIAIGDGEASPCRVVAFVED